MKTIKIFHALSHVRWVFFAWALYLMVQAFRHPARYALANTGLAVFLMGLFLGFLGFSDITRVSRRERKEFADPRGMRISTILVLSVAGFTFLMGVYFMNIGVLRPGLKEAILVELKTVGYHCFALGFGFLCYLKLIFDKYMHYLSRPDRERDAAG
ncbi:MAG TPA: hypothetical protein PK919_07860 [Candidatus Aminicenantes bacterium]|nr:hypothetical protein [Candidatus Aminicenantes bacterium]